MTQQLEARHSAATILPFRQSPCRAAVRFPVRLDLTIHTSSGEFVAYTENVSASGLLFVCSYLPLLEDTIEFTMWMPSEILGTEKDIQVHCVGRIVRRERGRRFSGRQLPGSPKTGSQEAEVQETRAAVMIDEYNLKA